MDIFVGKLLKHGEMGNKYLLRLGIKTKGRWKRRVHEIWEIEGSFDKLKNPIIHNRTDLRSLIERINNYSIIHAEENIYEGKKSSLAKIVLFPFFKFIQGYFLKMGLKDSTAGFVIAVTMSFHSFLSWSEMWLNQRKK
jgi:hypothetical protein